MTTSQNFRRAATLAALSLMTGGVGLAEFAGPIAARADAAPQVLTTEPLQLMTGSGPVQLDVEVADDPREQSMGLMFRTALDDRRGMLFLHGEPRDLAMWMRNTLIPLDMVFIRADGIVHRVEVNTEPLSERVIAAGAPVTAVLELAGGAAGRLGLKAGDKVMHRHFGTAAR